MPGERVGEGRGERSRPASGHVGGGDADAVAAVGDSACAEAGAVAHRPAGGSCPCLNRTEPKPSPSGRVGSPNCSGDDDFRAKVEDQARKNHSSDCT